LARRKNGWDIKLESFFRWVCVLCCCSSKSLFVICGFGCERGVVWWWMRRKQIWESFFSFIAAPLPTTSLKIAGSRTNDFWHAVRAVGLLSGRSSSESRESASPATVARGLCRLWRWRCGKPNILCTPSTFGAAWRQVVRLLCRVLDRRRSEEEASRTKEA
jgi:hypothetical protein